MAFERSAPLSKETLSFTEAVRSAITASKRTDDAVCVACLGLRNVGRARDLIGEAGIEAVMNALHDLLTKALRGGDTLERLEGARWGFVLHGCEADILEVVGRRLATQFLKVPAGVARPDAELGTALGIAFFGDSTPTSDQDGVELAIREAERALSEALAEGNGKVVIRSF
jgi:GGDEF domain-containing protein